MAAKRRAPPKRGRPTLYDGRRYPRLAYKLATLGLTIEELAEYFEVSVATLYKWQRAHRLFLEAITRGRALADAQVAEALYQRALGYSHKAEKVFLSRDGAIITHPYVEHYPPDVQAASLWLRNRQPKHWRDKVNHELAGADGLPFQLNFGPADKKL